MFGVNLFMNFLIRRYLFVKSELNPRTEFRKLLYISYTHPRWEAKVGFDEKGTTDTGSRVGNLQKKKHL